MGANALKFPKQRRNYWKEVTESNARGRRRGHGALKVAIENWSPQLFTMCMGTGILATLMHQNPWQFKGLYIISDIVWIIDIMLFFSILAVFITRWILFPRATSQLFSHDVEMTTYLSTTTIAMATLVELVCVVLGNYWNRWDVVAFALWWVVVGLSVIAATTTYWLLIRDEEVSLENLGPTLLYPVTGVLATATCGTTVIQYTTISDGKALPVLVVSYLLLGWGLFLAVLTLSSYWTRLLAHQTPPAKKLGAQMVPVGAIANAAYAFISLGYVAGELKGGGGLLGRQAAGSPVGTEGVGLAFYGMGVVMGPAAVGFLIVRIQSLGICSGPLTTCRVSFWMLFGTVNFIRDIRDTSFNLNHWSSAYPLGVYGLACGQLATAFNSKTFKGLTSAILVILVIWWLYLAFCTIPMAISGELFLSHLDQLDEIDKQLKEKEMRGSEEGRPSDARTAV